MRPNMTIAELHQKKADLGQHILRAIAAFEEETGCHVHAITLRVVQNSRGDAPQIVQRKVIDATVEVQL